MATVTGLIFLGSKISPDGDCSQEIKTLAPWKKSYDQPRQCIKKQRHCFADKGLSHQSYGFTSSHVWMWELDNKESWAPRNWCFWTGMLERTLESLLVWKEIKPVLKEISQSVLKEISPEYSLEGLMLKLQYFGHLMWRRDSLEKTLMLGKIEGRRRREWTWVWASSWSWWWAGKPGMLWSMGSQRGGHNWVTELIELNYWTAREVPILPVSFSDA